MHDHDKPEFGRQPYRVPPEVIWKTPAFEMAHLEKCIGFVADGIKDLKLPMTSKPLNETDLRTMEIIHDMLSKLRDESLVAGVNSQEAANMLYMLCGMLIGSGSPAGTLCMLRAIYDIYQKHLADMLQINMLRLQMGEKPLFPGVGPETI